MPRRPTYKPFLLTTTIRNPDRLKMFLGVLKEYNGRILTDKLSEEISGTIIEKGLYTPKNISRSVKIKIKKGKKLTGGEIKKILKDNPQKHKESGFSKGWPSRFDTWFKIAKELGFVFYKHGEKIRFSTVGLKLADIDHSEFEQDIFLNSFVKYQRNNPFRRVLNENIPLVLLLQVITKLNADSEYNNSGISKKELPLVIYWKDSDSEGLYKRIKKIRKRFGFSPSKEAIVDICTNEIMEGEDIKRNPISITVDYPDELIRKMRLTGLFTLRGGGRFIDINKNEQKKVNYILRKYSHYQKYNTEKSYFKYMSGVDRKLVSLTSKNISVAARDTFLSKWVSTYSWNVIKREMKILSNKRALTKDGILKYISEPIRLEFLTALAIKSQFPEIQVSPNYPIDDEGLPTSTAGGLGDTGDIECFEGQNGILVEVTMSTGRIQTMTEVWPISRHLEEFQKKRRDSLCYFVAPSIYLDSIRQINFVKKEYGLSIFPKTIEEFIHHLEESDTLY